MYGKFPEFFRKNSGKFPTFYFSGKLTTLVEGTDELVRLQRSRDDRSETKYLVGLLLPAESVSN